MPLGGKRRITFVVAVFPPENEPTAVMAGELARGWATRGDGVTVICPFPNRPIGRAYPGFGRQPWKWDSHDQVRVLRVWTWLIGRRRRSVDRVLENLSFGVSAALAVLATKRPDILLVESWPIASQVLIMVAARLRGLQVINYIKDVYPEALVAAGLLSERSRLTRFLSRLDAWLCRSAAVNITIGKGMTQLLAANRSLAEERFTIINDWIDLEAIGPFGGTSTWRQENGISESDFVCMFAGTLGLASRADILVEVARAFDSTDETRVVCIGEGVLKQEMERAAAADGLSSLVLLPFQPRQRVAEAQSCADVMLLTSSPEMGASSLPSKLITYLAVGKPVICSVDAKSDIARLVMDKRVGLVVEPGNAGAIVTAIRQMRAMNPSALADMSRRSRQLAVERFSLPAALERFDEVLDKVMAQDARASALLESSGHEQSTSRPVYRRSFGGWGGRVPWVGKPACLDEIVSVHLEAFPGFFMAQLGPWFLREYYRCVADYPQGVLLTECDGQGCMGFVAGFVDPASFYGELHRRRARLGLAACAGIVVRPRRLTTLLANYRRASGAAHQTPEPGTAELSSLAARPDAVGRGVESRLVQRFIVAAGALGACRVVLTTDANDNDAVNGFYQGLGFTCIRSFEARRGRWLNEYAIEIGKG